MASRIYNTAFLSICAGSSALVLTKLIKGKDESKTQGSFLAKLKANCATGISTADRQDSFSQDNKEHLWDWNWDKRQGSCVANGPKSKRTKKHYIFVRHGEYNLKGYNDEERYLTVLGREQADMTGKWLASLDLNYVKLVQSTMTRAKETCEIIAKHLTDIKIETTDLLREGAPIQPDPPNRANEPELKFFADPPRIESAFRKFVYRPSSADEDEPVEVYVCHANVIRYFLCRVAQFPPQGWLRISLRHGSITWVTVYSDGDVWIRCIGDAGFMPPEKLSR